MGTQGPISSICVKWVYQGLKHMEGPIRTRFDIQSSIPTLNNTTKNYPHRCTGPGTSHISQISIPGLEHMEHPIHTKFNIQACTYSTDPCFFLKNQRKNKNVLGDLSTLAAIFLADRLGRLLFGLFELERASPVENFSYKRLMVFLEGALFTFFNFLKAR